MARLPWLLLTAVAAPLASADPLDNHDRELLLEQLTRIKDAAEGRSESRINVALNAFRPAMSSNEAAIELYLKCVEKLDFDDQHRKSQDFREWKRRQKDRLEDTGMQLALRHQLHWLVLSLEFAAEPEELARMSPKATDALEAIFTNAAALAGNQNILRQSVTSSVFARAYNVSNLEFGEWPTTPLDLAEIYGVVIFPPLRKPDSVEALRSAWLRRIGQEAVAREQWSAGNEGNRVGTREALRPPAFEKFLTDERPDLIWRMEEDLFKAGDQRGAALRMLAHLERYVSHPKAAEWTDRFIQLISPPPPEEPPGGPGSAPPAARR